MPGFGTLGTKLFSDDNDDDDNDGSSRSDTSSNLGLTAVYKDEKESLTHSTIMARVKDLSGVAHPSPTTD